MIRVSYVVRLYLITERVYSIDDFTTDVDTFVFSPNQINILYYTVGHLRLQNICVRFSLRFTLITLLQVATDLYYARGITGII